MKSFSSRLTAGRGAARQDGRRLCAPGAAARPRDRHTRACGSEWSISKPGQAPQASRRPPIGRGVCVLPGQAPPLPIGTAAGPSGALHVGGAAGMRG